MVEVQLGSNAYTVAPGTNLAVPFALVNHTGQEDYFNIQVMGVPDDWVILDMPVMHLAPGERRETSITIQAPGISPLSAGVYPVTLRAVSQTNPEWLGEAGFNLTVGGMTEATRPAPAGSAIPLGTAQPYAPDEQIDVTMDRAQFTVAPGQNLSISAAISNRGMAEDTFYLSVDGLPPAWVTISTPTLHLFPNEQRPVTLGITPPLAPSSRAGRYPFRLRVLSQAHAGQGVEVDAVLTVTAVSQFKIDLNPRSMDAGRTARLRIHNLSNIQETYQVGYQSQGEDLEFVPNAGGPVNVPPGETTAVDFNVSKRGPNLFGGQSVIPYTVIVQSTRGETQSLSGEVSSRAVFPLWVLPALLVFLLTLLCGFGFLWSWNQNRLAGATQTAAANVALFNAQTATSMVLQQMASLTPATPTPSLTATPVTPTTTPIPPTATVTPGPTDTPSPTLTNTPVPATATATSAPTETATIPPLPVSGQQLFLFAANPAGGQPQLYLMNSSDRSVKPLTQDGAANTQPAWSPDGSKIAFTSNRDGNNEIYVMDADGSNPVNLTKNQGDDSGPTWSPDGKKIAFTSNRDGNNEIYVMNADGSDPVNLTKSPSNDSKPAWYTQSGLFTSTSRILFVSDRDGRQQIYAMNTDGSNVTNLSNNNANDSAPSVPYKGGKVAFVSDRDGNLEIYVMGLDGSNPVNLTQNAAADTEPAWSQDGKWITFISNRSGLNQAYLMTSDGKQVTPLIQDGLEAQYPAWR